MIHYVDTLCLYLPLRKPGKMGHVVNKITCIAAWITIITYYPYFEQLRLTVLYTLRNNIRLHERGKKRQTKINLV